jgi:hypothetical protein
MTKSQMTTEERSVLETLDEIVRSDKVRTQLLPIIERIRAELARRSDIQGTNTAGGKDDLWFRHTLGFRKIDEQRKIVHEHESVPFYMDGSFKAAVDLKP